MEKTEILMVLVGATLLLTLVNTYSIFGFDNKLSSISGNVVLTGGGDSAGIEETAPLGGSNPRPAPAAAPAQKIEVSVDDDPVKGSEDAPVTIIEFSDFECPFCARFYSQTLSQIEKNYIDTGKVKLVYRDFPLSFHQEAQPAAEAAECADEQGKFWEMHDKIFENQQAISDSSYKQWAAELGLDTGQFNECLDSGKYASEVQKDVADGQAYGVSGTPAFFINGTKLIGAQPYSKFEEAIENALKGGN
ncbi:MAG: DsbA family protein [Candidatus Diapherotrites archaeon]